MGWISLRTCRSPISRLLLPACSGTKTRMPSRETLSVQDRHSFGQGVFRLDAGFTAVGGVRLQQFNRSPQSYSTFTNLRVTNTYSDGNADFMEVAIPLEQLGGLRPGDTIKIAAVDRKSTRLNSS